MNLITTTALVVLMAITATNADEWNWLNNGEAFMEDLIREKRQDGSQNVTEVGDDDIINYILDSGRQGRSLEGFDEIYTDPSVMQAIQNSDDVEARNIIKEKLCALGLMQCDGELVDGRRPYLNPQNLIYAQPVALKPVGRPIATIPIRGPPGPPSQGPQYVPRPPQQKPHQGPYGPPQPMPPPNRPQQKVGFSSQQPPYGGPNSFSGSSSFSGSYSGQSGSFSSYPSKPLGPIYEGGDIPYEFETPNKPPGVIVGDGPAIVKAPVEQHIHHHYHHIEGGKDEKTIVVNNPIPLSPGVITGSAVGGSLSTSNSLYSSNAAYGNSGSGSFSSGGFNPVGGKDFDYQELKGSAGSINSNNNGYGQQFGSYASQSKPTGGSNNYYNQGPATFGSSENTVYGSYAVDNAGSGSSSNNKYNGLSSSNYQSSQGAFHASNPNLYKKELNVKGPANGLNSYSGDYSKYSQQSNGQYSQQSNGQFNQNLYSINNGQYSNGNQGQYNGNNAFSNRNEDCVCVPYDQCPAQDVVGRRDDLILPLDPRNLKTDIQADTEQVVITDSNGVMTIVQAPKNLTAESRSANVTEPAKKITKREASPASKKVDSEDDKAKIEPNIPTPAPGHSEGSNIVSFPRSRRSTDVPAPDQLEPVKEITDSLAVPSEQIEVQEKSISAEKRQAYYGARPQQCQARQVCCRRQVYRPPQPPTHANLGKCGVRNAQGINGRIKNPVYVDGDSEFGEYPWQVAILKKDPKESVYVCGGTLIDNQYIITAAHCVKTYNGFDLRVRLGEWDVNHDVEFYPYIERDVISVQVHPEYYAGTLDNDLAILKMDRPADFSNTPHISPACLPDKFTDFSGQRCWTTGWGKDAFGDYGKYQNILKEVDVPIINHQQCQNQLRQTRLGYSYTLNPGFLCAGGEEGKDACKGDGGGPLVCERNGSWQVVGIVSWGIGCGKANVPGVYVKVAHYLDWINQVRGRY